MKIEDPRAKAVREYLEAQEATRRKTLQLRTLREERDSKVISMARAMTERKKRKPQPLSAWLDDQAKAGRNT